MTEADICNQALIHVGQTRFIASLTENSDAARICRVIYFQARDYVLSAVQWPFAKREFNLNLLTGVNRSGWAFCYSTPPGFVHPRYIFTGLRPGASFSAVSVSNVLLETSGGFRPAPGWTGKASFEIQLSDDGGTQIICTDFSSATLVYTGAPTSSAAFPAAFVDVLSLRIASGLAAALLKKPSLADSLEKRYQMALLRAAAILISGQSEDREAEAESISVRG